MLYYSSSCNIMLYHMVNVRNTPFGRPSPFRGPGRWLASPTSRATNAPSIDRRFAALPGQCWAEIHGQGALFLRQDPFGCGSGQGLVCSKGVNSPKHKDPPKIRPGISYSGRENSWRTVCAIYVRIRIKQIIQLSMS